MTKHGIAASVVLSFLANAQTQKATPAFAGVEIRLSAPNTMPQMRRRFGNGRYELRNATALDLIQTAWGIEAENISGGPDWLALNRYDVIAAAAPSTTPEMLRPMLQGMLRDRFQLSVRNGSQDRPAYAITAGKKPQLKPAAGTETGECKFQPVKTVPWSEPQPPVTLACRNVTIANFARILSGAPEASGYLFNLPVLDRTGLAEQAWDFELTWSPRRVYVWSPAGDDAITLADAFEKIGLKLALAKVATPVLVVEKAVPPRVADAPRPRVEFEVAEIRPPDPNGPEIPCNSVGIQPGGRVRIHGTLRDLIWESWGAPFDPLTRVTGGPGKAMDSPCWDILAKATVEQNVLGSATPDGWNGAIWNGTDLDTMRMMLRSFLEDRFQLAAHLEDRMIDGYVLTAAGLKLKKANPANRPGCREGPGDDGKDPRLTNPLVTRLITCRNMTLTQFAAKLSAFFPGSPPIRDATGISGRFDMTISFSPFGLVQAVPSENGQPSVPTGAISLYDALKGQLGLKVESRKVTAPVIVVDRVNAEPTPN